MSSFATQLSGSVPIVQSASNAIGRGPPTRGAMSDTQGSAQATLLKAWISGFRQIAKRSEHEIEQYLAPPARFTVEDCAAAGFKMDGPLCARYRSDVMFQVNFSAGLAHQSMLIQRLRRWGRRGWSGTLLWIDGEPVPVPIDLSGNPRSASLAHWLNHRFATDFPTAEDSPQRAVLLWAWGSEVGRIAHGEHSFTKDYPAPPRLLTPGDCRAIGFEFDDEHSGWNFLDDTGNSTVRVDFSPDLRHVAVSIKREDWSGALLWVDGEPVPVPRRQDGDPLCDRLLEWLDSRFVYAQVGGLRDHPLYDPSKIDPLGDIRGVLVWDALRHTRYIEHPEPAQAWTSPLARARDGSLHIYADGEAFRQERHDRLVPVPD